MADEIKPEGKVENPTLDQPEPTGAAPGTTQDESTKALLETLNKLGVDTADPSSAQKLENMHFASSQAGRYANDLGAEREKVRALEKRLQAVEGATARPQTQDDLSFYGDITPTKPSITEDTVRNVMREEIGNYINMQNKSAEEDLRAYAEVCGDPEFGVVEELWNKHIANPHVQMALRGRRTTLNKEFNRVKLGFYKNLLAQAKTALGSGVGAAPGQTTAPHVEAGTTQTVGLEPRATSKDELIELANKSQGTDDDLDAQLAVLLKDGDQFLLPEEEVIQGRRIRT